MKTIRNAVSGHEVHVKFENIFGEIVEMNISAPAVGGYVRRGNKQLCAALRTTGSTLQWDGAAPLVDLVRREYRAMRRSEKAYKYGD